MLHRTAPIVCDSYSHIRKGVNNTRTPGCQGGCSLTPPAPKRDFVPARVPVRAGQGAKVAENAAERLLAVTPMRELRWGVGMSR